ncbi:MAG: dipicolinate synthase subunit B [Clostridia bacterium]|nr:dipicolinate synthase subunit B [Clostridia bacterium]
MLLEGLKIGFGITGSFCTFSAVLPEIDKIVKEGAFVTPIISEAVDSFDTRFGKSEDIKQKLKAITGNDVIATIVDAEPIGPKAMLDVMVVAPCTGNTIAKICNAITDSPVTMACKAHLRNCKPVVIAISTNDGLGANAKNIGQLLNTKNIYLVPFGQDNPAIKPNSLVSKVELLIPTILEAINGKQLQPVLVK